MNSDGVWTHAPRASARRTSVGYISDVGVHSSGNRMAVRSCTVTTSPPRRDGGTTKFVPCTTSTDPVHHSTAGASARAHARSSAPAAIGDRTSGTPGGSRSDSSDRPCHVRPYATRSTSVRVASAGSIPATKAPTPVRLPTNGVASTATRNGMARQHAPAPRPSTSVTVVITALAGGVGAARFLRGLIDVVPPSDVTAIVNTGDDIVLHGLHISPDLDTVTYTLADAIDRERGWGLGGETWAAMDALERYHGNTWFRLGDRDLGTHLHRTQRLSEGATLTAVTAEIVAAWGLALRVLPMSDDRVETRVVVPGEG